MGAIFICLKNTFQRHFGKLYARISHIVVEYSRYSDTTNRPPRLPTNCLSAANNLHYRIKVPQFCNAHFTILHHTFNNSAMHKPPDVGADSSCPPLRRYCFVAEYSSPPSPFIPLLWAYIYTWARQICPYRW